MGFWCFGSGLLVEELARMGFESLGVMVSLVGFEASVNN
jgi:hypothetical protein